MNQPLKNIRPVPFRPDSSPNSTPKEVLLQKGNQQARSETTTGGNTGSPALSCFFPPPKKKEDEAVFYFSQGWLFPRAGFAQGWQHPQPTNQPANQPGDQGTSRSFVFCKTKKADPQNGCPPKKIFRDLELWSEAFSREPFYQPTMPLSTISVSNAEALAVGGRAGYLR